MIRLDGITKHFPGAALPAVRDLSLSVPDGQIVILVGPSGCGKTTTMKMVNRLIEPSAGRIYLDGQDVTSANPDRLRRRIGYVIQQVGLFPHLTVAQNIAVVPRMLGWDRTRTSARVDELLTLVGLEPGDYRGRYPKQLSGGQQQRVGVARALGGDPPVLLMDEPFGAIDPINRHRLQSEFLRIQREIRKTIIFVTHDIDEAIRMGDRIAILGDGASIAQYDTPANILANPASQFVEDFVGAGATIRRLTLRRVGDLESLDDWPSVGVDADPAALAGAVGRAGGDFALVLDERRRPVGWTSPDARRGSGGPVGSGLPMLSTLEPDATLFDALDGMLRANSLLSVVVDGDGVYRGTLTLDRLRELIHSDPGATPARPGDVPAARRP
ncbi:MAG TPA: ABC transporter ATP-binding protein [Mycobacteriales bacterium]|nr:ABC transporter ATP-binding protein [Mycobacteriales bacterium]